MPKSTQRKIKKSNLLSKVQVYSRLPIKRFGKDMEDNTKCRKLSKKRKDAEEILYASNLKSLSSFPRAPSEPKKVQHKSYYNVLLYHKEKGREIRGRV